MKDTAGKSKQHLLDRVYCLQATCPAGISQRNFSMFSDIFPGIGCWWWSGVKKVKGESWSQKVHLHFYSCCLLTRVLPTISCCDKVGPSVRLTRIFLAQLIHLFPLFSLFSGNDYSVNSYVHASGKVLWYRLWLHWQPCQEKSCTWQSQKIIVIQIMNSSSIVLPALKRYFHVWCKMVLSKGGVWQVCVWWKEN